MSKQTFGRRDLLKAAATAFTTSLFSGNVRGANDRPPAGFIGIGVMGAENLNVAWMQGVEVAAVCDVYQPHLERAAAMVAATGRKAKQVKDFREVVADR